MKRITKIIFIVLVAVAFVATGCKKESEYKTVTLGAKIAPGNSKVYIHGYTPKWNGGDVVNVNGNPITVSNVNGASAELHDVTESDYGYYAYYPADQVQENGFSNGVFTVTLPAIQEYEETTDANSQTVQLVKAPMGAKTVGGSLTFHNLCSLLKVTVNAGVTLKIAEIKVTAGTTNLSGSTTIPLSGEATYTLPAPATGSKSVTLSFGNTGKELTSGSYDFYIYLPAFGSSENRENVCVEVYNIDANNVLGVCKKEFTDIYVTANTINTVGTGSLTASSFTTTGAINGLFSVSADKKVRFSMGNLKYSARTWSFHTNQYDHCFTETGNVSENYTADGTFDLFGWGTSGNNHGAQEYQPYAISTDGADYYAYSDENLNLYDGNGTADWGRNTISNTTGEWRTLNTYEWEYLMDTRTGNQVTHSWMRATINGTTNGIILFPDGYDFGDNDATILSLITNYNAPNDAIWADDIEWPDVAKISSSNWNTLQNAGCVFLPAAGSRNGSGVGSVGKYGCYWSSSAYNALNAWDLSFGTYYVYTVNYTGRMLGHSVRLVQDY